MFYCLKLVVVLATVVPHFRGSCGTQLVPAAEQGATSCGCENLKRAAAVESVEASSPDPAEKYSRAANEGLSEARVQVREIQGRAESQQDCS